MEFNKVRIVLKSLMNGIPIEKDGRRYFMTEDYELCIEGSTYQIVEGKPSNLETCYLPVDTTLGGFVKWCNEFSEEDTFTMAANLTLNKVD